MDGSVKNGLKTIVSLNRDWLEGTKLLKIVGFGIRIPCKVSKNESIVGGSRFFSNLTSCHRSLLEWERSPFRDELTAG